MAEPQEIPSTETPVRLLLVEDSVGDARLFQELLADAAGSVLH